MWGCNKDSGINDWLCPPTRPSSWSRAQFFSLVLLLLLFLFLILPAIAQMRDAPESEVTAVLDRLGITLPYEVTSRGRIASKIDQLRREQCDQTAIFDLSKELETAGYRREAAKALIGFSGNCGGNQPALRSAANILLKLTDYAAALEATSKIIELRPYNDNGYYLRALAHDGLKNHQNAIADYITAIELFGNKVRLGSQSFLNMSSAYTALGRHCDAMRPIEEWIAINPARNDTSQTRAILSDLSRKGNCADETSGTEETIPISGGTRLINVTATVNGVRGRFVLDTGATFLAVRQSFATSAKISLHDDSSIQLHTANGFGKAALGRADTVKLGKLAARNVAVAVQADSDAVYGEGIDGLLGMSFLSRFDMRMDARSVNLKPRAAQR